MRVYDTRDEGRYGNTFVLPMPADEMNVSPSGQWQEVLEQLSYEQVFVISE
jgi:hypothetical protein